MSVRVIKILSGIILIIFMIFWSYNMIFKDIKSLIPAEEELYSGIINIGDFPRLTAETGSKYGWIQERIKRFEKRYPGVYIEFTPMDEKEGYSKMKEEMDKGNFPDIIPVNNMFPYFDKLQPLNEYFTEEELESLRIQATNEIKEENDFLSLPVMLTTYTMYLNLDLFNERGVSPPLDGNWTYEEFVDVLKKLTYDSDGDGIVDRYGFLSFVEEDSYNIWGMIISDGAQIIDPKRDRYAFYGEKSMKGLEKVMDLKTKYEVAPGLFGYLDESECWEMFTKEKVIGVYPGGSWLIPTLQRLKDSGEGFNFDIANYPMGDEKLPTVLSSGIISYGIMKGEDEKKTDMCVRFLKYLLEESSQRSLESIGTFPVIRGIEGMYSDDIYMQRIEDSLSYTRYIPVSEEWIGIEKVIQQEVKFAIQGYKTSYEAIEDAKNRVELLLQ